MAVRDANAPEIKKTGGAPQGVGNTPATDPMVDSFLKLRQAKVVEAMVNNEFGGGNKNQEDGLAASIVKGAMEIANKSAERAEKLAERNDNQAVMARQEADKAKETMFSVVLGEIGKAISGLSEMREDIRRGAPPPRTLADTLKEAQELRKLLDGGEGPRAAAPPASIDANVSIQLEGMRQNHELAMKRLDLEIEKMKSEYSWKLQEWKDNREIKLQEYEDSKKMRDGAFGVIGDIAAAASAAFGGGEPNSIAAQPGQVQPAPGQDRQFEAFIVNFPCQLCHTVIAVPAGAPKVKCPNPECGTEYEIRMPGNAE